MTTTADVFREYAKLQEGRILHTDGMIEHYRGRNTPTAIVTRIAVMEGFNSPPACTRPKCERCERGNAGAP